MGRESRGARGRENQRVREHRGSRGIAEGVQGDEGAAGGGSRRWRSGAGASTRLCLLAEVEDGGELGWASQVGCTGGLRGAYRRSIEGRGRSRRWKQEVELGRALVDTPLPTGRG